MIDLFQTRNDASTMDDSWVLFTCGTVKFHATDEL